MENLDVFLYFVRELKLVGLFLSLTEDDGLTTASVADEDVSQS